MSEKPRQMNNAHGVETRKTTERKPKSAASLANLRRGGGRPKGVPNKAAREIKEAAKALIEDPVYLASLKVRLAEGKAPHMETALFHYAYGKPKEQVELTGANDGPLQVTFVEVRHA